MAEAEQAVEKMATQLVFSRVPAGAKARRRQAKPEVKVLYFRDLFDTQEDGSIVVIPPAEQPTQHVMFAL